MTQKEAIIEVLQELGGRAQLKDIYPRVLKLAKFKEGSDTEATTRNCLLTNPSIFRSSPNKPKGWWELVSFQEEMFDLKSRIAELEKENTRLKSIETADHFVERLVEATKNMFATKHNDAKSVQQVLLVLNRMNEQQELMEWIVGKPTKVVKKSITKRIIQKNINSQVFNGNITESEFNGGGTGNE